MCVCLFVKLGVLIGGEKMKKNVKKEKKRKRQESGEGEKIQGKETGKKDCCKRNK